MRIVITGADGFIGQNLRLRLAELGHTDVTGVTRATSAADFTSALRGADFVYHLAGVNRPTDPTEFQQVNAGFTADVARILAAAGRPVPIAYTSSTQAELDNPYGVSKRAGERILEQYGAATASPVFLLRLTNVFGKWSRPNYNSAIATFCHNLAHDLPITVSDPARALSLVYIDDVVSTLARLLDAPPDTAGPVEVAPVYATTLGEIVTLLRSFAENRRTLTVPASGRGLPRALWATYLSYLRPAEFSYALQQKTDPRGSFVEVLRTPDAGQVSYFTAPPGITRGEHYHHTKAEKFLVVRGRARFGFRHVVTNERHEVTVEDSSPRIVETVPGWVHNITNIGSMEMVVMVWASEVFDAARPDTIPARINP